MSTFAETYARHALNQKAHSWDYLREASTDTPERRPVTMEYARKARENARWYLARAIEMKRNAR